MTSVKNVRVANDPWGDGRTLEWAIQSPPLYYNFAQTPLVRGLDTVWIEKMEGNKSGITPAEPVQDIHMPNGSIIPFFMSFRSIHCRIWCNVSVRKHLGVFQFLS